MSFLPGSKESRVALQQEGVRGRVPAPQRELRRHAPRQPRLLAESGRSGRRTSDHRLRQPETEVFAAGDPERFIRTDNPASRRSDRLVGLGVLEVHLEDAAGHGEDVGGG